jgi:hypothetical protein
MARLRKLAMPRGAFWARSREASSRNVVSLTRCDRFSIAQCRRTSRAMSAGLACGGRAR